ncbi:MAG: hypothetical protein RLZZ164_1017 [Actinomycetota bacterium]|jgi:uncharacterized protein (TIGR00251 family)
MQVSIRVKPGSSKGPLVESTDDGLIVYLKERAVDGAANEALIAVLAKHFGVTKRQVEIASGHAARIKRIRIDV